MRAENRQLKHELASLRRQDVAPHANGGLHHTAGPPLDAGNLHATQPAEPIAREHERELVELRRQVDDLRRRNTALLVADAEHRSSGACVAHSTGQAHALEGQLPLQHGQFAQCYASAAAPG